MKSLLKVAQLNPGHQRNDDNTLVHSGHFGWFDITSSSDYGNLQLEMVNAV